MKIREIFSHKNKEPKAPTEEKPDLSKAIENLAEPKQDYVPKMERSEAKEGKPIVITENDLKTEAKQTDKTQQETKLTRANQKPESAKTTPELSPEEISERHKEAIQTIRDGFLTKGFTELKKRLNKQNKAVSMENIATALPDIELIIAKQLKENFCKEDVPGREYHEGLTQAVMEILKGWVKDEEIQTLQEQVLTKDKQIQALQEKTMAQQTEIEKIREEKEMLQRENKGLEEKMEAQATETTNLKQSFQKEKEELNTQIAAQQEIIENQQKTTPPISTTPTETKTEISETPIREATKEITEKITSWREELEKKAQSEDEKDFMRWGQTVYQSIQDTKEKTSPQGKAYQQLDDFWSEVKEKFKERRIWVIDAVDRPYEEGKHLVFGDKRVGKVAKVIKVGYQYPLRDDPKSHGVEKAQVILKD